MDAEARETAAPAPRRLPILGTLLAIAVLVADQLTKA